MGPRLGESPSLCDVLCRDGRWPALHAQGVELSGVENLFLLVGDAGASDGTDILWARGVSA